MDLLGDETTDAYKQLRKQLLTQAETAQKQAAGQQVIKAVDERGREVIIPSGQLAAPSNARTVPRFNADGTPKAR